MQYGTKYFSSALEEGKDERDCGSGSGSNDGSCGYSGCGDFDGGGGGDDVEVSDCSE